MAEDESTKDTQVVDASESFEEHEVESLIGKTIAGKYEITRRLARGGMGVVYLAQHKTLGRPVVFKVLSYHLADDKKSKSRFEREARGLSVLEHPNIVTVHDFGHEKGLTYIVMEYVHGENLSQRVRREGRIPYDDLLPIMLQTIGALGAAHEKGIVHRDIKPSNVMVTDRAGRSDFVKVLDFGLAKLAHSSVDLTKGNLVGTVSYLAPEVIKGGDATPASDVYSLGVMFYYLLAGSKPFEASDDMSVLYQHVNDQPDRLEKFVPRGEAPENFLHFIHRCMDKDPAKRPSHANEMKEALNALVSLPSISAFSIESSNAIPRLEPPDSSAEQIRPLRHTPSQPVDHGERSSPSAVRRRTNRYLRIGVAGFTTLSIGLLIVLLITGLSRDEPEKGPVEPPSPAPATTVATPVFELVTTPSGEVAVDGEPRGKTPIELELEPGTHQISVAVEGHQTWAQAITLEEGERRRVDVFLPEEGADTRPKAKTIPAPAKAEEAEPSPAPRVRTSPDPKPPEPRRVDEEPEVETGDPEIDDEPAPTEEASTDEVKTFPVEDEEPDETGKDGLLDVDEKPGSLLPVD